MSNTILYSASIATAPLMFLLIMAFAETTECFCGLYELKQTCCYTIHQITALRTLCYGVAGTVFTTFIAIIGARDAYEFLSMFSLCLSALAVCAALSLIIMRFVRNRWMFAVFSGVWVFISIAPALYPGNKWEGFLSGFPVVLSVLIALIGAVIFSLQISKMLAEVNRYAFT